MSDTGRDAELSLDSRPIEQLPLQMGFTETPEMADLRQKVRELTTTTANEAEIAQAVHAYEGMAMAVADRLAAEEYTRAQIGFNVAMALIWKDAGNIGRCGNNLYTGLVSADNQGYTAEAAIIEQELVLVDSQSQPE